MNDQKAREILGDTIQSDSSLFCLGHYVSWTTNRDKVTLDDAFTVDELEAIAYWMRTRRLKNENL